MKLLPAEEKVEQVEEQEGFIVDRIRTGSAVNRVAAFASRFTPVYQIRGAHAIKRPGFISTRCFRVREMLSKKGETNEFSSFCSQIRQKPLSKVVFFFCK